MDFTGFSGETQRMRLRPYALADFEAFHDLHRREDVARYLPWDTRDEDASRAALERHRRLRLEDDNDGVTLAAFDKATDRLVGELVIFVRSLANRGGEVGYVLHPDFQRRGLATEGGHALLQLAFGVMGMHRVVARIDARNHASAAVLGRLGMRREALFVKNVWFKGEWADEAHYALLDEEWQSRANSSAISWNTSAPSEASSSPDVRPPA